MIVHFSLLGCDKALQLPRPHALREEGWGDLGTRLWPQQGLLRRPGDPSPAVGRPESPFSLKMHGPLPAPQDLAGGCRRPRGQRAPLEGPGA